jgi:hypothetical protein
LGLLVFAHSAVAFHVGDRIMADPGGANVRNGTLTKILFTQTGGVHGTIVSSPMSGTAGGFSGNWWPIKWDSQPPSQGDVQGWSAQSVTAAAPSAGDIDRPPLLASQKSPYYRSTLNKFFPDYAPPFSEGALGNCTWYAQGRLLELGYDSISLYKMLGDADTWDNSAKRPGSLLIAPPRLAPLRRPIIAAVTLRSSRP